MILAQDLGQERARLLPEEHIPVPHFRSPGDRPGTQESASLALDLGLGDWLQQAMRSGLLSPQSLTGI